MRSQIHANLPPTTIAVLFRPTQPTGLVYTLRSILASVVAEMAESKEQQLLRKRSRESPDTPSPQSSPMPSVSLQRRIQERQLVKAGVGGTPKLVALLVEDDAVTVELAARILSTHFGEVDVARNGVEALEKYSKRPYDAVFMNLALPIMDGFEATAKIRSFEALKSRPPTPIIALSVLENVQARAELAGCTDFMTKPMTKSALEGLACLSVLMGSSLDLHHIESEVQQPEKKRRKTRKASKKSKVSSSDAKMPEEEEYPLVQVLVAEDNIVNVKVVSGLLKKLLHRVTIDVANNGQEAVDMYTAEPAKYDVILMDCHMPIMDGWVATMRLRQYEEENSLPRVPVIAVTASPEEARNNESGITDLAEKPIGLASLKEVLLRYISFQAFATNKLMNRRLGNVTAMLDSPVGENGLEGAYSSSPTLNIGGENATTVAPNPVYDFSPLSMHRVVNLANSARSSITNGALSSITSTSGIITNSGSSRTRTISSTRAIRSSRALTSFATNTSTRSATKASSSPASNTRSLVTHSSTFGSSSHSTSHSHSHSTFPGSTHRSKTVRRDSQAEDESAESGDADEVISDIPPPIEPYSPVLGPDAAASNIV
jgi:CheY-like chemotaxis protein